jgi:uncharacterized protein YecE (DUF72 family)
VGQLRIGTSGWSYHHWLDGVFYPGDLERGGELAFYATVFDCVEINSSFYHTPRESTLRSWANKTPENFSFAYKASRTITHRRKLLDVREPVDFMLSRASLLGPKLGPILWQFPPSFTADIPRLANFLALLPRHMRHAFEFRHGSWFCDATYEVLGEYEAALVWSDTPSYPLEKVVTARLVYVRLHGHEKLYSSCYTRAQLQEWAESLFPHLQSGHDVFVFFDNDAHGYAPRNALELREIMQVMMGQQH